MKFFILFLIITIACFFSNKAISQDFNNIFLKSNKNMGHAQILSIKKNKVVAYVTFGYKYTDLSERYIINYDLEKKEIISKKNIQKKFSYKRTSIEYIFSFNNLIYIYHDNRWYLNKRTI